MICYPCPHQHSHRCFLQPGPFEAAHTCTNAARGGQPKCLSRDVHPSPGLRSQGNLPCVLDGVPHGTGTERKRGVRSRDESASGRAGFWGSQLGRSQCHWCCRPFPGILLVPLQLRALASGGFPHRSNDSCQELPGLRVST